jgi:peptidoglycan/xylan/chitin deacetylase (PgdA/CDA1 family)
MRSVFRARAAGTGSTAEPRLPAAPAPPADPEVVIRQARARQRRRRRRTAAMVALVMVAGVTVSLAVGRPSGVKPLRARTAGPVPSVDAAAFAGHGELAFVSRGTLWVLDGRAKMLRRVPTPGVTPSAPAFSPDGRGLAFLGMSTGRPAGTGSTALWLASGDGRGAHQVRGLREVGRTGWNPARDVLAVTARSAVWLVWPSGRTRALVTAPGTESAAWSPEGSAIAVATATASASTLASYPLTGGHPAVWVRLHARGGINYLIDPAGWWRDQGIGYWALADSASLNADGDPFYVISSPGAHPRLLGATLADTGLDQVSAAQDGWLAIVAETHGPGTGDRLIWRDRTVKICGPAATQCTALASPPSTVALDPAWSPGGAQLAFVQAPSRASPTFPQHAVTAWYDAHQLWAYSPATRSLRKLDASGATVPAWSADGHSLLYIARDGIWLLPRLTARPVRIATPLFTPGNWPAYYGQVDWNPQFAWWSGQPARPSSPPRRDWPLPGSVIRNLGTAPGSPYHRGQKVVALTFDDGPSRVYTPQILRILIAAKAPASFEIVGLHGAAYPGILAAENAAGMALVNHTWTHVDLALLPARRWPAEVDRTSRLLHGITGHPVRCLRLPYGLGDPAVDTQLRARGLAELGWDLDPSDYLRPPAAVITRRVLAALHPGAIVIMHDGGGNRSQTVAALPAIIRSIRATGYQIVPACAG